MEAHLSPRETAERLGVSLSTVWRLIRSGELPSVKAAPKPGLSLRTRVKAAALETFVKERSRVA